MKRRALKELELGKLTEGELAELIVDTAKRALPAHLTKAKREYAAEAFRELADLIEELP